VSITIIILLLHKSGVVVCHRSVAVVGKAHGVDVVCPVLPCAGTVDFGISEEIKILIKKPTNPKSAVDLK